MGLYGLEHVSDLSKELRERTCDLERHVLKLQAQQGSRVHVRRPRLPCSGDDCDAGTGAGPEGDAQDGGYDDSDVPSLSLSLSLMTISFIHFMCILTQDLQ